MSDLLATARMIGTTSRGNCIWCHRNEAGGLTYTTDEVGGGAVVWNTALAGRETLALCLAHEMSTNGTLVPEERPPR